MLRDFQLSRHPKYRNHRGGRQIRRNLLRVGPQREGGHGDRLRGQPGGEALLLRHEARGPERGRRPPVHRGLHRRKRGYGHRRGRRPGNALLPERAGFPALRPQRQDPHAGALRLRRGPCLRQAGLRAVRTVRHPGFIEDVHPGGPLPVDCGDQSPDRGPRPAL